MATSDLQGSLLQAIDYLVNNRIDKINKDVTITCTIKKCNNSLTQEYQVNYNGGFLNAYAQEGTSYSENQEVFVLVPEGDFTKRKLIIGKASQVTEDENITFVSSLINDYNMIGQNTVIDSDGVLPKGLRSYLSSEYILLYQRGDEEHSIISFNENEFSNYVKDAEALLIEASFMTRLPKAHRISKTGKYGIQFVLAFRDTSSGDVNKYDEYLPEIDSISAEVISGEILSAYQKALEAIWGSTISVQAKQEATQKIVKELQNQLDYVKNNAIDGQIRVETLEQFISNIQGIDSEQKVKETFTKLDEEVVPRIKYISYVLDSNNMTGNPFLYNSYTDQYAIFPIDAANYLYVDSIMIWSEGFVTESDTVQADFWGADILVKEPEIYGLRKITATNGDYVLRLSTPQGAVFTSFEQTDTLTAMGTVMYQVNTNVSDSTTYYWFVKDDRIDASSEEYNIYGGSGWRYLSDKGNNREMETSGYENRAYENIYTLAAVYKEQVILKQEFTFYNEAASRDITIESDLGTTFSFDRGTPVLTCMIDGNSSGFDPDYPDEYFTFSWSKIDEYGSTTALNVTYEDLEKQYDEAIEAGLEYNIIASIRNRMIEMEGVEFDRNVLKYPISQIAASATFSCSVFLKETETGDSFFIGSAQITLSNEDVASPTDYYILIENGDQVFQYSESGVAPTSERYQDPQEVLPLECHFYDPAGLEVNAETYAVKWKVPLDNTLIVTPREGMAINPATNLEEWYTQATYPLDIEDSYDYQATTNQVTCIVTYQGVEYQRDSDLFFTKVGENGTNGTDVVCKISPVKEPSKGLLAIKTTNNANPEWNNGQGMGIVPLKFQAYNRTELLNTQTVLWTVSGGNGNQSRYLSIGKEIGDINWEDSGSGHRNQIVRGETEFEGQTYYAFYPIPHIDYRSGTNYEVIINKTWTLKSITYNADGRNPLYNKNQGLFFSLSNGAANKYVVFDAIGGIEDNSNTTAISLSFEKNSKSTIKSVQGNNINEDGLYYVYITPDDVYDGAWCNNIVRARIYGSEQEVGQNPEATVYMPIYMSLNTFGLASLNAWDGNHVEINEDENYILAPQIGAGYKDDNNRFTGVVMGTAQTYDQSEPNVGLLGYSEGKQSIFLDAATGNAIFGLPEDQASTNNHYTEGRIELIPGGESKIGMWTIGSRAMYNMTRPPTPIGKDDEGNIEFEDEYVGVQPDDPYKDYPVPDAQISVPPEAQGLILNANPAYISVKGMPLNDNNSNIDWAGANTTIKRGDSIEVELDPRKSSVFSIYRHTTWNGDEDTGNWRRYPMVGINANGQFYTNAIEDGESSMGIGKIGAFGKGASDDKWVGAQFAYQGTNIFKFFIPNDNTSAETRPLYISTGSRVTTDTERGNEYPRDFNIYGKTLHIYTNETISEETTSGHWLKITNDYASLGHTNNYIQIPSAAGSNEYKFEINTQANANFNFTGAKTDITNAQAMTFSTKTFTGTINSGGANNQALTLNITGSATIQNFRDLNIASNAFPSAPAKNYSFTIKQTVNSSASGTSVSTAQMRLGNNNTYLELNNDTVTKLNGNLGVNIESATQPVKIRSNQSADGVQIDAYWGGSTSTVGHPYLHLTPQSSGTGDFVLSSGHGTVKSKSDLGIITGNVGDRTGVEITPGMSTKFGLFTDVIAGTNDSIQAKHNIWGSNFNFNAAQGTEDNSTCLGAQRKNTSMIWHLETIYSLIQSAYDQCRQYAKEYADGLNSSTRSWADGKFALSGHTHSNYVTNNTFNSHRHSIVVGGEGFLATYSDVGIASIDGHSVITASTIAKRNLANFIASNTGFPS